MRDFLIWIGTRVVAFAIGLLGFAAIVVLFILGKIRVGEYWKLVRHVFRGNVILAPNHPTLVETLFLPILLGLFGAMWPSRFFIWNMPQINLFPNWLRWLNDCGHCIPVERRPGVSNRKAINAAASRKRYEVLTGRGTVVHFPGGGRDLSKNHSTGKSPRLLGKRIRAAGKEHLL